MATGIYAAAAAFFLIMLSVRVIRLRREGRISVGHGGDPALERAMRAHANFSEYAPLVLILLALIELGGAPAWAVHGFGLLFLAGRLLHFLGFRNTEAPGVLRVLGMVCTFGALAGLGVVAIGQAAL